MPRVGSEVIRNPDSNRPKLLVGDTREDRKGYYGLVEREYKLNCRDGDTSCSTSTLAVGAPTAWAKLLAWISRIYSSRTSSNVRSTPAARELVDDGSDS